MRRFSAIIDEEYHLEPPPPPLNPPYHEETKNDFYSSPELEQEERNIRNCQRGDSYWIDHPHGNIHSLYSNQDDFNGILLADQGDNTREVGTPPGFPSRALAPAMDEIAFEIEQLHLDSRQTSPSTTNEGKHSSNQPIREQDSPIIAPPPAQQHDNNNHNHSLKSLQDHASIVSKLTSLGNKHFRRGDFELATNLYTESLDLSSNVVSLDHHGNTNGSRRRRHHRKNKNKKKEQCQLVLQNQLQYWHCISLHNLGVCHYMLGRFELAMKSFESCACVVKASSLSGEEGQGRGVNDDTGTHGGNNNDMKLGNIDVIATIQTLCKVLLDRGETFEASRLQTESERVLTTSLIISSSSNPPISPCSPDEGDSGGNDKSTYYHKIMTLASFNRTSPLPVVELMGL